MIIYTYNWLSIKKQEIIRIFHLLFRVRRPSPKHDEMALSTTELLLLQLGDVKMSSRILGSQVTRTGVKPIQVNTVFPYILNKMVRRRILPV